MKITLIKRTRTTPLFNVGMVSQLTGIPVYTLRWIEQSGFVEPSRSEGNQRIFTEQEVELLQEIRDLMEKKVNLAGIEIILKMRAENSQLKKELEGLKDGKKASSSRKARHKVHRSA